MTSAPNSQPYHAARTLAALISRDRGRIVVSGKDRGSYLQGLLTNDIVALGAGQGCYAAYLTAQGRMITDLDVYELGDVILLTMVPAVKDTVLTRLDQFIFSEDVQLLDATGTSGSFAIVGPQAAAMLGGALSLDPRSLEQMGDHASTRVAVDGEPLIVLRVTDTGEPGFEIVGAHEPITTVQERLREAGAVDLDFEGAEALRIERGVPLFGRDMDEDTIPLEAGIEQRAISFSKGCYVGQEVIIRVLHRGHGRVARKLVGLSFEPGAAIPAAGSVLVADGKEIGSVTSGVASPALGRAIALAYVKRDFVEPGTIVTTADGKSATVTALPFRSS
jgi:folate-binding protein YgfZ